MSGPHMCAAAVVLPKRSSTSAPFGRMVKVSAFELEFNADLLPPSAFNLSLGSAVWIPGLHGLYHVSEFFRDHAKKENNSLFIDRLVTKTTKVDRVSIRWPVTQFRVSRSGDNRSSSVATTRFSPGAGHCADFASALSSTE